MNSNISIITKQYDDKNNEIDKIKVSQEAKLYRKGEYIYVVYKEDDNENKITTTIKISDEEVSIKRFGTSDSSMVFKKDTSSYTKYKTPQGIFIINIDTKRLNVENDNDKNVKIDIEYNIDIMDLFKGKNKINIVIKSKE